MKKLSSIILVLFLWISTVYAIPPIPPGTLNTTLYGTVDAWGSGSGFTWTFNAGATDPTFTFGSGTLLFGSGVFTFPNVGLSIYDTNASHYLILAPGSNLTANKTLTFTTGDSDRTITLSGNPTLADWFDQAVKAASAVTFATVDTGQGAYELYAMNQNVLTTSSPTFSGLTLKTVTKVFADTGYTALSTDFSIIWNAVGGACVMNLPAATGTGRILEIKKVDASANLVTITTSGAELLDGFTTQTLTAQWEAITIQDTAAGVWHIL